MDHGLAQPIFVETLVLLTLVAFTTAAFRRAGIPPALGLLAAGVVIGPAGFAFSSREGVVAWAGELGLLFLLFLVGLELSAERIRTMAKLIFRYGLFHFAACTALIGGAFHLAGFSPTQAGVIGAALAMSSTAFVSESLRERGWMQLSRGRRVLGGLLFQDLAVGPIFALLPILGMAKAGHDPVVSPAIGAIALVLIFLVARLLLASAVGVARQGGKRDAFPAAVIAAALAMGGIAEALGMSPGVGALLAGVALAGVEWRNEVKREIEPFKATLISFIFIGIGMAVPLESGAREFLLMAVAAVGLMAVKTLAGALAGLACKQTPRAAVGVGLALSQAGEFSFLILALAAQGGGIEQSTADFLTGVAVISMVLTVPAMKLAETIMGTPPEKMGKSAAAEKEAATPATDSTKRA